MRSYSLSTVVVAMMGFAGCSGLLIVEQDDSDAANRCLSSSECGIDFVCVDGDCRPSPGRCSVSQPNGDCPLGRECNGGICVLDTGIPPIGGGNNNNNSDPGPGDNNNNNNTPVGLFDCTQCAPEELCGADSCVDPTDVTQVCSSLVVDGACPLGDVCVAGTCVEIKAGKNDCSAARPNGLCPPGGYCTGGFCFPIAERPCSGSDLEGACPAGQQCISSSDGALCDVVECTETAPFAGQCRPSQVCLNGECEVVAALLSCEEIEAVATCASLNREECTTGPDGIDTCGACVSGFVENLTGVCESVACADLNCEAEFRVCDSTANPVACGDCDGDRGYRADGNTCAPILSCAERGCDQLNRNCEDGSGDMPATCTSCVDGFILVGGVCEPRTCDDIDCDAENRVCIPETDSAGAQCGGCVGGIPEVGGLCANCTRTTDCGSGWCDNGLCTVDCNTAADCATAGLPASSFICTVNQRCAQILPGGETCGAGFIEGEVVEPLVGILVDQSGSMSASFDIEVPDTCNCATTGDNICDPTAPLNECGMARWYAMEAILFGTTNQRNSSQNTSRTRPDDPDERGLITQFQDRIQFALGLYTNDGTELAVRYPTPAGGSTMNTGASLEPALDLSSDADGADTLRTTMAEFYSNQGWRGDTPSSEAIVAMDEYLRGLRDARVSAGMPANDLYIILATDGEPDYVGCLNPNPTSIAEYRVLEAANLARRQQIVSRPSGDVTLDGATVFSLSVGADTAVNHFQDAANAGAGVPTMTTVRTGITDIGTYPGPTITGGGADNYGLQSMPATNPYFEAYATPSDVNGGFTDGTQCFDARDDAYAWPGGGAFCSSARNNDDDCPDGATCCTAFSEVCRDFRCYDRCNNDGDCTGASTDGDRCRDRRCYWSCNNAGDCGGNGDTCLDGRCVFATCTDDNDCITGGECLGGRCLELPDYDGDQAFSNCGDTRNTTNRSTTTRCIARNWPNESDYDRVFADLSSNDACDAGNPCTRANEVCCGVDDDSNAFCPEDNRCRVSACTPEGTRDAEGNLVMAPCFIGNDGQALGEALEGIFTTVLSCRVELDVSAVIEAGGTVFLDDDRLLSSDWEVVSPNSIEILDDPMRTDDPCDIIKDGNEHFVNVEINQCDVIGG